jgi:hypothetical protein
MRGQEGEIMGTYSFNGIKCTKAQWEELKVNRCTTKEPPLQRKYDINKLVNYKEIFTAHLPMGYQYTASKLGEICPACDIEVEKQDLGCVKCLTDE